jgi:hypothetical protein
MSSKVGRRHWEMSSNVGRRHRDKRSVERASSEEEIGGEDEAQKKK